MCPTLRLNRGLLPVLALLAVLCSSGADCYFTILHFNDFHGYLEPVKSGDGTVGGIARIATAADRVEQWNRDHGNATLFVEAGDMIQGTPMSMIYQGEPDVKCLNLMDLDLMCVGNHEFDFGQDNFHRIVGMAEFGVLSANIYREADGQRLVNPWAVLPLPDGTQCAIIGLTSKDTAVETLPKNVAGLRFADPIQECRRLLDEIVGQAEFLVALSHIGYEEDLKLAEACPELDVIIGAHSHTVLERPVRVGKTLICQAGSYGRYLGQLDMLVRDGDVAKHRGFLREMNDAVPEDPKVKAVVDEYASKLEERLGQVIAQTTVDLDGERDNLRSRETNLGNLICDLLRDYTRADVCLVNAGGIRASVPAGPITVGTVLKVVPFSNRIATKRVSGDQLWRALERSASLERPAGGFFQVSGLSLVIDGNALESVMVGNEPLDRGATYTLAAPEFLLQGGDGYELLTDGEEPVYLGFTDNSIVIDTLKERGTVSPAVEGRIVIR